MDTSGKVCGPYPHPMSLLPLPTTGRKKCRKNRPPLCCEESGRGPFDPRSSSPDVGLRNPLGRGGERRNSWDGERERLCSRRPVGMRALEVPNSCCLGKLACLIAYTHTHREHLLQWPPTWTLLSFESTWSYLISFAILGQLWDRIRLVRCGRWQTLLVVQTLSAVLSTFSVCFGGKIMASSHYETDLVSRN